jgi:hypothetical protein
MPRRFLSELAVPLVSVLPTSPVDGQVIDFLASATDGVIWRFRYRAASTSPYKWECVGGAPWATPPINNASTTGGGSLWTTTLTEGTALVGINLPLAGDYFATWNGMVGYGPTATTQPGMGIFRPNESGTPYVSIVSTAYGNGAVHDVSGSGRLMGCTVGRAAMAYLYTAQVVTFYQRLMSILPIRVG